MSISNSLTNNGTLVTYGDLNHLTTLDNTNGTVQIATDKTLNITGDKNLGGTLDLNNSTLNMQTEGDEPIYSTLTVNILKNTGDFIIDANLKEDVRTANKIIYSSIEDAIVNVTSVGVREGFTTHTTDEKDNWITILVNNGTGPDAELSVGTNGKTSTVFGEYIYTFTICIGFNLIS